MAAAAALAPLYGGEKKSKELNVFEVKRVESERLSIAKTSKNELFLKLKRRALARRFSFKNSSFLDRFSLLNRFTFNTFYVTPSFQVHIIISLLKVHQLPKQFF